MKRNIFIFNLSLLIFSFVILNYTLNAMAASSGMGFSIETSEDLGSEGGIVSFKDGKYYLSDKQYDLNIYGILSDAPVTSVADTALQNQRVVVASGDTDVRVNTSNGDIKKGDFITSSDKPGIGMKATKTGQIIGIAEQEYSSEDKDAIGTILVFIEIHSQIITVEGSTNVLTALKAGLDSNFLSPIISFRYIVAALVAGISFIVGFSTFGRVSGSSVEALGRNPLASGHIKRVVFFNFILTFFIMLAGLFVAYLIMIL